MTAAEGSSLEMFLQDNEDAIDFQENQAEEEKEILNLLDSTKGMRNMV